MQMMYILGREAALSMAELEAVLPGFGGRLEFLDAEVAGISSPEPISLEVLHRLGGTQKMVEVLEETERFPNPVAAVESIFDADFLQQQLPTGRVEFGVSLYGCSSRDRDRIRRRFFHLKKQLITAGRSVRLVTSQEPHLSTVTVVRQGLLKHGQEFVLHWDGARLRLGVTRAVQDYQAYGFRDMNRPAADPASGMLPIKVAQVMLNIARVQPNDVLLDPFCGSGTILQEAVLLGVQRVFGSDASQRAVRDSQANLRWLLKEFPDRRTDLEITLHDVRESTVKPTVIVTEPWLGKPLRGHESPTTLRDQLRQLEKLYLEAFRTWARNLAPGGRVVMVWPVFTISGKQVGLDIADQVAGLGFAPQAVLSQPAADALNQGNRMTVDYGRPDARLRRQIRFWIHHR